MSLDVVNGYDEEYHGRGASSLGRSSSSTSSTPARRHYSQQQHNLHTSSSNNSSPVAARKYQYVPYSTSSSQPSPVHNAYGSQTSLPAQPASTGGRAQYVGFTSQGIAVQRLNRGHHPDSRSGRSPPTRQNGFQSGGPQPLNHSAHYHGSGGQQRQQGFSIAERQARSSSLKANARHMVDRYAEFSDAHHQFNNHASAYRGSSSSSENSPQGSPHHTSPPGRGSNQILARTGHPRSPSNYSRYQHQEYARQIQQQQADNIQEDLHEMQSHSRSKHSSKHGSAEEREALESPYRSSSRNTFASTGNNVPRRVSSNESFSFASSIKCCVGMQPKRKKGSRRALAFHNHHQPHQHSQRVHHKAKEQEMLTNGTSDNWVSLASVRSQYKKHASRHSGSHSMVSCPYVMQSPPTHNSGRASKHSSGYVSEMESSQSMLMGGGGFESESDMSDSEFARTAGSRGKSANTVMMKLAKKFSKKNLPINRDDGDGSSIGGDSLGKGEGKSKMKHRSSSVSNLDSIEG